MNEFPESRTVYILYTNHRGETSIRKVLPLEIAFTTTEWHPNEQWLLRAYDLERKAERRYALQNIRAWSTSFERVQEPVRVGVGILVVDRSRQILLGKRLASYNKGVWAVPAGHMECGETIEAAARRELAEETAIQATQLKLIGVNNYRDEKDERQYVNLDFLVEGYEGQAQNREPDLCEQLGWFPIDSLPTPLSLPTRIAIESFLTGQTCVTKDWNSVGIAS